MSLIESSLGWLALDRAAGDLEGQIHRGVRERILAGQITAGQRLPATRRLAVSLGLARSTVVHAYERLQAEGFLETAAGSATRVAILPSPFEPQGPRAHQPTLPSPPDIVGILQPGVPDIADFPHAAWARCLGARARALRLHDLGYGEASGLEALRSAILAHVSVTRGVVAEPDQVLVFPSTGAAIDILARLLLRPGEPGRDIAWIEEPGYPAAQMLLREAGARLVPVPCDEHGIDIAGVGVAAPRLVYVTPSHQYPTGVTMTLSRRLKVLDAAQAAGALILEDDYDSEFQYTSRPIAALQGIDRGGSVAYLGTFSKVLAPGLRVAYAVLPLWLVDGVAAAQRLRGAVVPIHMQAALADFLREGYLRAHIRRMSAVYALRMATTVAALRRHCAHALDVSDGVGGLQLAAWLRDARLDDHGVTESLNGQGIAVRSLSALHLGPSRHGLLVGIARTTPDEADTAARRIAEAIEAAERGAP